MVWSGSFQPLVCDTWATLSLPLLDTPVAVSSVSVGPLHCRVKINEPNETLRNFLGLS